MDDENYFTAASPFLPVAPAPLRLAVATGPTPGAAILLRAAAIRGVIGDL